MEGRWKLPGPRNLSNNSASMSPKMAPIDTVQQAIKGQKDGFQPPFQIHNHEGHNDCSLAGMIQLCHDPTEVVATFSLAELAFNGISIDLVLTG